MKNLLLAAVFICAGFITHAQSPVGTWKTIDDETGAATSYIKIYQTKDGKLQGKVEKILEPGRENANCTNCSGDKKDKPIIGMVIMWGLAKDGDEWSGGQILDPKKGKQYKCTIKMKNNNQLELRGYIGFSLIGRTQVWDRME